MKLLLSATTTEGGNSKPDQTDVLAELNGFKASLSKANIALPDLISQHASLGADKTRLEGEISKLTGDKSKLTAGATLPTDLVSAANEIAQLKSEKKTVAEAVASKLATLGITDTGAAKNTASDAKPKTLTEKVLEAKGVKTLDELNAKMADQAAKSV